MMPNSTNSENPININKGILLKEDIIDIKKCTDSSSKMVKDGVITFVCISDTHTKTDKLFLPPGDVLLCTGDFTRKGSIQELKKFNQFVSKFGFKHKIVIAGNHELTFDINNFSYLSKIGKIKNEGLKHPDQYKALLTNCTYLEDESVELYGYKIYGTPYIPYYRDGSFTIKDKKLLTELFNKIPDDTDILMTHSPPFGIFDKTKKGVNAGSDILLNKVKGIKPKFHIYGHIHEGNPRSQQFNNGSTTFIHCSICNDSYKPVNLVHVFTLPIKDEPLNKY